jgi:hypothetical protein
MSKPPAVGYESIDFEKILWRARGDIHTDIWILTPWPCLTFCASSEKYRLHLLLPDSLRG